MIIKVYKTDRVRNFSHLHIFEDAWSLSTTKLLVSKTPPLLLATLHNLEEKQAKIKGKTVEKENFSDTFEFNGRAHRGKEAYFNLTQTFLA